MKRKFTILISLWNYGFNRSIVCQSLISFSMFDFHLLPNSSAMPRARYAPAKKTWLGLGLSLLLTMPTILLSSLVWKAIPLTGKSPQGSFAIAQGNNKLLQQGSTLALAGKTFPVNWIQWQEGGQVRTGISDLGAMQVLGIELLDSNQPQVQPSQWFSTVSNLTTQFIAPYRYLDLTDWLQQLGNQAQAQGDTLMVSATGSQVTEVREGNQAWGKRIVLTLSRPTFWQVSQAKTEGVVMLNAAIAPNLLTTNAIPNNGINTPNQQGNDEDDLGSSNGVKSTAGQSFRLENLGANSKIYVSLPTAHKLQMTTLNNPYRLVIDIRPDAPPAKTIVWAEGVTWRQQFIDIGGGSGLFPVTWLELNLASPQIALKPLTANPQGLRGIVTTANLVRAWQASAGINGGFFNRNTQLPLGAIKRDNRWLSGPILNRGAIAWDDQGKVTVGRLSLQESLTTSSGQQIAVNYVNSGFVQKGIARYTTDWGANYTPMTDNETIIVVQNNQVTAQQSGGPSGQNAFPIPPNGYLLTLRGNPPAPNLSVGTPLTLQSSTIPAKFNAFPQIVGAGPLLIEQGKIVLNAAAEKFNTGFQQQRASRSAIAVNGAGKMLLVAVHNRVGGQGATLAEMALILKKLGAESALNLDGGSSTSLALGGQLIDRSAVTAARVNNGLGLFIRP
jgi:exopolysaccharide biosynthesis protein